MLAGYVRVWLSMEAAIDHVLRIAQCGRQEARDALVQAVLDGEIRSRFGDMGLEAIKEFLWENARYWAPYSGFGARMPNRVRISGDSAYLRPYFDPPPLAYFYGPPTGRREFRWERLQAGKVY
jgi:hypothetical protein